LSQSFALSQEEIDFFRRNGYVVPKFRFSETDVAKLQRLTLRLVACNPEVHGGIRRPHLADGSSSKSHEDQAAWLSFATDIPLLDIIAQLIGPNIILWTSALFYKLPFEAATPWHRDGRFYPIKPLATITAWIAVFNTEKRNAALRVIPGSHICERFDLYDSDDVGGDGRLFLSEVEESKAVDVHLRAGQALLFDVSTAHSSWPNASFDPRAGYAVRFFPATSVYDRGEAAGLARDRELILVRGQDQAGNIINRSVGPVRSFADASV
jgi:ectoine hydroxylase-related dioxygenase (phytanoyl-CoA dioxygenase family)